MRKKTKKFAEISRKPSPDRFPINEISFADARLFGPFYPREYNPDSLVGKKGLTVYRDMTHDEQIKAALFAKQFAVLSSGWEILPPELPEDEQELGEELTKFVEFNFGEMEGGTLDSNLLEIMSALTYGFSVTERVYRLIDYGDFDGLVGIKALKTRKPDHFDFVTDPYGNLDENGVRQLDRRMPKARFVIWSYRKTFNNFYGKSDLREAYRAWWQKDQIMRFMLITLERYGEPITVFTHEGRLTGPQNTKLQTIINRLQPKTGFVLPGNVKVDFKSPDVKTSESYIPGINLADTHISRAILIPGLMGLSPEQVTGSHARSLTEFDVFLWIIGQLRQEIAQTVVNDQMIKPLIDLNYEVTGGRYPRFQFKSITEEHKHKIFELWSAAVKDQVLEKTRGDENKGRSLIDFPPLPEEEEEEKPEDETPDDDDEEEITVATTAKKFVRRTLTRFEKRVDFKAIGRTFDTESQKTINQLQQIMVEAQRATLDSASRLLGEGLTPEAIPGFTIDVGEEFTETLSSFLETMWRKGRDQAVKEFPLKIRREMEGLKQFAGFEPTEALRFFRVKSLEIKGLLDQELTSKAKFELFEQLKGGRTTTETIGILRGIFEPFVGDPTKIGPSGPGRLRPENLLQAHRLENIVRTPMAEAFNQGRLAVGDAAADFVIGYQYSALLDTRTTDIDKAADGLKIRADDPRLRRLTPPLHYQCRGTLVFITSDDLPVSFSSDAGIDRAVRLVMPGFGRGRVSGPARRRPRPRREPPPITVKPPTFAPEVVFQNHPQLESLRPRLIVDDYTTDSAVRDQVADLARMASIAPKLTAKITATVHIGSSKSVPDMWGLPRMNNKRPRGWPAGSTWREVGGGYNPRTNIAASSPGRRSGSQSTILHEVGHSIGDSQGLNLDAEKPLRAAQSRNFSNLRSYYRQGGKGGAVGSQELLAESTAYYFKPITKNGKQLTPVESVAEFVDREFAEWLAKQYQQFE